MNKESKNSEPTKQVVIDATGSVLGRLASFAAKKALLGYNVIVVNCENAILTGNKRSVIKEYYLARTRGGSSLNGPFFPKQPYRIVKRTIRGMLDYTKGRGDKAFKKVMCYDDVPEEYSKSEKVSINKSLRTTTINLKSLSKEI
jgi:large subunit ribosomal protein L13